MKLITLAEIVYASSVTLGLALGDPPAPAWSELSADEQATAVQGIKNEIEKPVVIDGHWSEETIAKTQLLGAIVRTLAPLCAGDVLDAGHDVSPDGTKGTDPGF